MSFVTTSTPNGVTVSSTGAVSVSSTLAAGTYTVSGTDSDAFGDTGTWSFTLTVNGVSISQGAPASDSVSTSGSSSYTNLLSTTGQTGTVSFVTTSTPNGVTVSSTGAVSVSSTLAAGTYTVSGTDSDAFGDTGTWSFTLTVTQSNTASSGSPTTPVVSVVAHPSVVVHQSKDIVNGNTTMVKVLCKGATREHHSSADDHTSVEEDRQPQDGYRTKDHAPGIG